MEDIGVVQCSVCLFLFAGGGGRTHKNPSLRPRGKMWGQLGMLRVLMQVKLGPHLGPNGIGLNK